MCWYIKRGETYQIDLPLPRGITFICSDCEGFSFFTGFFFVGRVNYFQSIHRKTVWGNEWIAYEALSPVELVLFSTAVSRQQTVKSKQKALKRAGKGNPCSHRHVPSSPLSTEDIPFDPALRSHLVFTSSSQQVTTTPSTNRSIINLFQM